MPDKYANAKWGLSMAEDAARDPRDEDPTLDELTARLHHLAARHPGRVTVEQVGESVGGNPLWAVEVTDREVSDEDKQVAMFVGCEHGNEHSGGTALLHVLNWLVSTEAAEVRRTQRVVMIPVVNPDGYDTYHQSNMNGVNLYADYSLTGPPSQPESRAVWEVMERYAPEVFGACHGHWRQVRTYAFENCQGAYGTSRYDRTHARLFAEEVNRACEAAGYPQDRMEEDSERVLSPLPGFPNQGARSGELITPGVYAYHRFHTMLFSMEIMYEESGLVKIRKILELGNQPWRYENTPGYPVRVMTPPEGHAVVAYGTTAAERRASRLELWRNNDAITRFALPTTEDVGFVGFGFSVYPEDAVLGDGSVPPIINVGDVLDHFAGDPNLEMALLREAYAPLLNATWSRYQEPVPDQPSRLEQIEHGLSLRVRLLPGSRVKRLLVNGREVGPSAREGYEVWTPPGGATIMQLNLPGGPSAGAADGRLRRVICALEYEAGRVGR